MALPALPDAELAGNALPGPVAIAVLPPPVEMAACARAELNGAPQGRQLRVLRAAVSSPWLVSLVAHAWLLLILALIVFGDDVAQRLPGLVVSLGQEQTEPEQLDRSARVNVQVAAEHAAVIDARSLDPAPQISLLHEESTSPGARSGASSSAAGGLQLTQSLTGDLLLRPIGIGGGGLEGRGEKARALLVARRGGSAASERAVERGLRWLVAHQLDDGSWSFNHQKCPHCRDLCSHPGSIASSSGATALALLPFLGAGSTHLEGEHREVVQRGLYYLGQRMLVTKHGGDLQDGTMYAQGLATIALCEAYAMSHDENLRDFAQAAVDFIVSAQHKEGGWRYLPGQPGDTTVLGWQLMALKSAQMAGLNVPPATFYRAARFLDSVQQDEGAFYGYQGPGQNATMTSVGLLSRMYLGWPRTTSALERGVSWLAELGPSETNLYFDYYAAQVLNHWEGPQWESFNARLRDHLIRTQAIEGHESGSWYFDEPHTKAAGRHYNTAIATMILEVYYRYLPLYTRQVLGP